MRHDLSGLAEAELQTLAEMGIQPTFREVVHVVALAGLVETGATRIDLSQGTPIPAGDTHLWPLTLYSADWWQRIGAAFRSDRLQLYALAYAMAHGRDDLPEDAATAKRIVKRWAKNLRCTYRELQEAIMQVQEQDTDIDTEETGPAPGKGDISMMLSAMTGVKPEVWERQCGIPYVFDMINVIVAQNGARGESLKHDPRMRAERALGLCLERIIKRHTTSKATDGE